MTMANPTPTPTIYQIIQKRGAAWWFFKLIFIYLGHPILFLLYLYSVPEIFGFKTFNTVSTNVDRINIFLYILITLPLFILWLVLQVQLFKRLSSFRVEKFIAFQAPWWSLLFAVPGFLNFLVWATDGMEGNVFGFLFFLPMLIASFCYVISWIVCIILSFYLPGELNTEDGNGLGLEMQKPLTIDEDGMDPEL